MWTSAEPLGTETAPRCDLNFWYSLLVVQTETCEGMGKCLLVILLYVYKTNSRKQKCICGSRPLRLCFHCLQLCKNKFKKNQKTKNRKIIAKITFCCCCVLFFSCFYLVPFSFKGGNRYIYIIFKS